MSKTYYLSQRFIAIALCAIFAISPVFLQAQDTGEAEVKEKEKTTTSSFSPYWFVRGNLGANIYYGDVARYRIVPDLEKAKLNGELTFGRQFASWFGVEGEVWRGFLAGQKGYDVDKEFESDIYGADLNTRWNLSNIIFGYKEGRFFNVELTLGIGQAQYKSKLYQRTTGKFISSQGYKNSPEKDKGSGISDRKVVGTVPVGISLNFRITDNLDANLQSKMTFADTKYLDGFHRPSNGGIEQDRWNYTGVGLTYKFRLSAGIKKMDKDFDDKVTLEVIPEFLEERGDSIEVTIKGSFPAKYFAKKAVINFTPVLKYENGETAFPGINLIGEDVVGEGKKISHSNGGSFTYTAKIKYNEDMKVSELVVNPVIYTYRDKVHADRGTAKIKENAVDGPQIHLAYGVIQTSKLVETGRQTAFGPHGYEKVTISKQNASLYFFVNSNSLSWRVPLNKDAANKDQLKGLTEDMRKGWEVKDITITGFASPEGEESFNQGLSDRRSSTAKRYVMNKIRREARNRKYDIRYKNPKDITFKTQAEGPDWDGLMAEVKNTEIQDKNAILKVYSYAALDQREKELNNLVKIYPELEEFLLPPLRRAHIEVNCIEPKYSDEDIMRLSTVSPDSLKITELLYAASLFNEKNTRKAIYTTASKMFPQDYRAFSNLASYAIEDGNINEALAYLETAKSLNANAPEVLNNFGVVAAIQNNWKVAKESFEQARANKLNEDYNLGVVAIHYGDFEKAVKLLAGSKCDFNYALALVLTEKYSKAKKVLACAPQTANSSYLMAVVEARQDNAKGVYENLMKAFKMNPSLKKNASTDREFRKFEKTPEFKAIIK
ncbi:MAG: hypothetical protein ACEPOW_07735 [Bacteroidales bacterium]